MKKKVVNTVSPIESIVKEVDDVLNNSTLLSDKERDLFQRIKTKLQSDVETTKEQPKLCRLLNITDNNTRCGCKEGCAQGE